MAKSGRWQNLIMWALKALFRHWQQGMHNVAWNAFILV
ncbi:Trehalose-6-phosphate hydrolase [Salmonella enterica subsp. enterica]|uniref:Trehalose-6-phosphate hydrolase n=1 Tax=Salmonella enterica I TaxID=59201 RepID=A0A447PP93_SALET|nr:Trehalose-6-phosphate hydrolase [Salmonella enterica subsp. enterica]